MFVRILIIFLGGLACSKVYAPHVQHTVQHRTQSHNVPVEKTEGEEPLFLWPLAKERYWISSFYGQRKKPNGTMGIHEGIDLAAFKGTPVMAAAAGLVIQAELVRGYGNMVLIAHDECYQTRYAHLDRWCVTKGQTVQAGECIGFVGDTGTVRKKGTDASHLHFEIHKNKKAVNPLDFLPKR